MMSNTLKRTLTAVPALTNVLLFNNFYKDKENSYFNIVYTFSSTPRLSGTHSSKIPVYLEEFWKKKILCS